MENFIRLKFLHIELNRAYTSTNNKVVEQFSETRMESLHQCLGRNRAESSTCQEAEANCYDAFHFGCFLMQLHVSQAQQPSVQALLVVSRETKEQYTT